MFVQHRLISDRNFRTKRWIRHHHVQRLKPDLVHRRFVAIQVTVRKRQRVHVENITLGVRRHHHVHRAGPHQERIEVCAKQVVVRIVAELFQNGVCGFVPNLAVVFPFESL